MPIKKIEIHGLNPDHPITQVIDGINHNLDAVIDAINSIEGGKGVVGETGAKGDKGDPGQQGIEGPQGVQGERGLQGEPGPSGKDGKDGKDGQPGRDGLPGRDGVDGKDGKDGLPGAMGPQGPAGVQGLRGEQGIQGVQGPAGKDGATGPAGPQGVAGPAGKDGVSITSAAVNSTGNLIITKSDGTTVDAGKVSATATTTTTSGPPVVGGAINPMATPVATAIKGYIATYVDAGTFVTLDNLKFTVTSGGQRGLSCATVSGSVTLSISASYGMIGGASGNATTYPGCVYNTTPSGSWFGWSFPNAGDGSTYLINDYTNQRVYRVHLMIGPGYTKNFISIERLL